MAAAAEETPQKPAAAAAAHISFSVHTTMKRRSQIFLRNEALALKKVGETRKAFKKEEGGREENPFIPLNTEGPRAEFILIRAVDTQK